MSNKKFIVDVDLDDSGYRRKIDRLIDDSNRLNSEFGTRHGDLGENLSSKDRRNIERMRLDDSHRVFNSSYSETELSRLKEYKRLYKLDKEDEQRMRSGASPFSTQPRLNVRQKEMVEEAQKLDKLNKNLEDSGRLQTIVNYENRSRHQEYRTLTNNQLEQTRRQLKRGAEQDERAGRFNESDAKREEIQAINQIINKRTNASPEERAMRQLGKNYFMTQMMGEVFGEMGEGGRFIQSGVNMGTNAYGAMRASGATVGQSAGVGIMTTISDFLFKSLMGGFGMQTDYLKTRGTYNYKGSEWLEQYQIPSRQIGMSANELMKATNEFSKRVQYGGIQGTTSGLIEEKLLKNVRGLESSDLDAYYRYGRLGNRMNAFQGAEEMTYFLSAIGGGVSGVKLTNGMAEDLSRLPEYMKQLVTINEDIYRVTGDKNERNQRNAQNMFMSMIGLGGMFAENPETSASMINSLRSGFRSQQPIQQYMNIQAYKTMNPNANMTQIMEGLENTTDVNVVNAKISSILGRFGFGQKRKIDFNSSDNQMLNFAALESVKTAFDNKISTTQARQFIEQFQSQGGLKQYQVNIDKELDKQQMLNWSEDLISKLKDFGRVIEDTFKTAGSSMLDFNQQIRGATSVVYNFNKASGGKKGAARP